MFSIYYSLKNYLKAIRRYAQWQIVCFKMSCKTSQLSTSSAIFKQQLTRKKRAAWHWRPWELLRDSKVPKQDKKKAAGNVYGFLQQTAMFLFVCFCDKEVRNDFLLKTVWQSLVKRKLIFDKQLIRTRNQVNSFRHFSSFIFLSVLHCAVL